jgi:hypothetical protein
MRLRVYISICIALGFSAVCAAANKNPCEIITKIEAETLLGKKLVGPELSPRGTLCKYYEPGYGESPAKNKLITIGLFYSDRPGPDDVNMRRQAIIGDKSISPFTWKEIPNFADAALWEWAGGYFGALYAFRGGTTEVAVKIGGLTEQAAMAAAKKFATRALGTTTRTGFVYNAPSTMITEKHYDGPGILGPLYLGAFNQIPDDEMTRNYVLSLVQQFNGSCQSVPETFAILSYGAYYEWKANNGIFKAGAKMDINTQFQDMMEVLHRVHPHMLEEGHHDALAFLDFHGEEGNCYTPPVDHLYNNIAELALQRQNIPPDVDNDTRFLQLLSPSARAHYKDGIPLPNHPSLADQQKMQKVKQACLDFTKGSGGLETFCRCHVDAMKEGHVASRDLDIMGMSFNQQSVTELSKRYPVYDQRKKACYH